MPDGKALITACAQCHRALLPMDACAPRTPKTQAAEIGGPRNSDRNGNVLFMALEVPVDRRAALRAKVERYPTAAVTDANVLAGPATDRDAFSTKACLRTKHTAGAALTSQAMADRDSDRFSGGCCGELAATAGCFTRRHGGQQCRSVTAGAAARRFESRCGSRSGVSLVPRRPRRSQGPVPCRWGRFAGRRSA